jgi:multidrug efflux system membrane fusion protein
MSQPNTPSVSPQKRGAGRRALWFTLIFLAFAFAGALLLWAQRARPQSEKATKGRGRRGGGGPVSVTATTVRKGNMNEYIEALGTVTSVYTVAVESRVAGTLVELDYKEGQIVHKGDLLAVIDPRPYQASLVMAQGTLVRDQALLENARIDLTRYQTAFQQHAIPEQTLATQVATVRQDEGTVKTDQGNVDAAQVNVDYTRITSPITGRVGLRGVDLGNIVAANGTTPLVTITQLEPITVIFNLAENYVGQVFNGMRNGHHLRVDALNRADETELAQGTMLALDSQIDTTTGTVRARATFTNRNNILFPNEFVNARLLIRTLMGVNVVPNAAIQRNNNAAYVYVINSGNTVQSRNVNLATSDTTDSAVTGVSSGERVVTDGFDSLQDGSKVTIRAQANTSGATLPPTNQAENNTNTSSQPGQTK